jgi:hypothetical protein
MNVWYVKFPLHQYNENVKELAKINNLKIVDDIYQGNNNQCNNIPVLTAKGQLFEEIVIDKPKRNITKKNRG